MLDNLRDKLPFVNSMKNLIFVSTKILLPKCLVLSYSLIVHYQILFTLVFKLCPVLKLFVRVEK